MKSRNPFIQVINSNWDDAGMANYWSNFFVVIPLFRS